MTSGVLITVAATLLAYFLAGGRSSAYLLYFLAFIPFVTLDASAVGLLDQSGFESQNVRFKLAFRALTTLGFLVLLVRRRATLANLFRVQAVPVVFFFLWSLLSLHRARAPWVSFFRLGELFAFFVAGAVLFAEAGRFRGPRSIARWHCLALLPVLLVAVWFQYSNPELTSSVRADGLERLGYRFLNSNTLGFAAVAVGLWATVELREQREFSRSILLERFVPLLALGLACYVLLAVHSRTAMLTMLIGQVIVWAPFPLRDHWRSTAFGLVCTVGVLVALSQAGTIEEWFLRGDSASSLRSGTGRTGLWAALLREQLPRAPFLGAGYLMLSEQGFFLHDGSYWSNAHNTYVFALISTGLPGGIAVFTIVALPWFALLGRSLRSNSSERPFWLLLFALQTVVALGGIPGFGVAGYPNPVMLFHYTLYAYVLFQPRREPVAAIPEWRFA